MFKERFLVFMGQKKKLKSSRGRGCYVNYNSIRYPKSVHKVCRMKKTILCILTTVL